ncbi:hypothetical protein Dimus_030194, partial [Dionaea muscipula]
YVCTGVRCTWHFGFSCSLIGCDFCGLGMASVLCPTPIFLPGGDCPQTPDVRRIRVREHESISLLKKCKGMEELKQVHGQIVKLGLLSSSFCVTHLVESSALPAWGSMDYASSIFGWVEEPGTLDYNAMIKGYVRDLNFEAALLMFEEMLERGVVPDNLTFPSVLKACAKLSLVEQGRLIHGQLFKLGFQQDVLGQNSLINMYGKCGRISDCCSVFEQMENKNVASWSSLIAAHANLGMWVKCLELFRDMNREGCCKAEDSIMVSVLSASTHLGALDPGKCTHGYLLRNFSAQNVAVETCLIDMYIKCGLIEKGLYLFQRMSRKNQFSYSVMISGLAMYGHADEALRVFSEMQSIGLQPEGVVYVGVLTACKQALLVEEGLRFFDQMRLEHGIQPEVQHYACITGLLGRAGLFDRTFKLIKEMPMEPNEVVWRSLLSASKVHGNLETGEIAARRLMELGLDDSGDYVMLANMYADAQRWGEVSRVRTMMASRGLTQVPGFCLVDVKRKSHRFVSHDRSHPNHGKIYEMIHQMEWQLKFEGYSPDTSVISLRVSESEEERRQRLRHHSQKLALAFALLHSSEGTPIRITRNTRMCRDCHTYTKFISRIYNREIIIRERNQFHHFRDATCSCNDLR